MKRNILLLLAFIITPLINNAQMVKMNREITEVYLTGNGYELGLQHGQQLKPMVNRIVDRWKANVKSVTGLDPVKVMDDFFAYAAFTPAIKKWTPELFEEIRGIADGAGNSFNEIFVLNLLDEFWVYLDDPSKHHCSGMGVPARMGMPSFLSQNMDLENYTDSMQVIMHIAKDDGHPEQIILTHPGLIALNGMNETGVGVCVNTLMQLKASNKGLPVAFIIRHIIGSTDRDQIIEFIKTVEHASGQNYIIGIRDEVFDFEASANKVVRFDPENANGTVYHTNHPLVNDDIKAWHANTDYSGSNSQLRLEAVSKRMISSDLVNAEEMMEALKSKDDKQHPVCRANNNDGRGFTFASVVMHLGIEPYMLVCPGPPDENNYRDFIFSSSN